MASISTTSNNRNPAYYGTFIRNFQAALHVHLCQPQEEDIFFERASAVDFSKPLRSDVLVDRVFHLMLRIRHPEKIEVISNAQEKGRTWSLDPDWEREMDFERIVFDAVCERILQINRTAIDLKTEGIVLSRYRRLPVTAENVAQRLVPEVQVLFRQPEEKDPKLLQHQALQLEDQYIDMLVIADMRAEEEEFQAAQENVFAPFRELLEMPSRSCTGTFTIPLPEVRSAHLLLTGIEEGTTSPDFGDASITAASTPSDAVYANARGGTDSSGYGHSELSLVKAKGAASIPDSASLTGLSTPSSTRSSSEGSESEGAATPAQDFLSIPAGEQPPRLVASSPISSLSRRKIGYLW